MAVPANVICLWDRSNATIPAGWTRETKLDACYVQGAIPGNDADLTTPRGQATHTHTSPSHTPLQNSHLHTFSTTLPPDLNLARKQTGGNTANNTHTHDIANSASTTATNNGVAITVNANASNDLPYVDVIFIKSDGTPTGFPHFAIAFFGTDTLPSNWNRVYGNTYFRGAATNGDGGGTGGSATHTHTSPAHTHTQNSHTHANSTSAVNLGTISAATTGTTTHVAPDGHTHTVQIGNADTATNNAVTVSINAANHEPLFVKLNAIQNGNAQPSLPQNIIALWGGTNASIPTNWSRFTLLDANFVKGAAANGESGNVSGGSQTHTHTTAGCQPTQNSHNHGGVGTDLGESTTVQRGSGTPTINVADNAHLHDSWTVNAATATNQLTTVSIDPNTSESAYPPYRRVIFIQFAQAAPAQIVTTYTLSWPRTGAIKDLIGDKLMPEQMERIFQGDPSYYPRGY